MDRPALSASAILSALEVVREQLLGEYGPTEALVSYDEIRGAVVTASLHIVRSVGVEPDPEGNLACLAVVAITGLASTRELSLEE